MSAPKLIFILTISLFGLIGVMSLVKKEKAPVVLAEEGSIYEEAIVVEPALPPLLLSKEEVVVDRVPLLFTTTDQKLPIVETVTYKSRVPWLKGRPAWITDYAAYYQTSRHFIARSLNRKADYYTQKVASGNQFNVFRTDKDIRFHFDVDLDDYKMSFYYLDGNEKVLLKVYKIGIGRLDKASPSGSLTPEGNYSLGDKVAIYKPGIIGFFQEKEIEMIQVFGTRWIPFNVSGYGFHGAPWVKSPNGEFIEDRSCIGVASSDGCIRLLQEDIEEIFSIVITKPTTIEVKKRHAMP
ncbi:MAG: L,D-transpeptidase [Simkaniaceae bacterium]|nr:L,D-transpeptidase [Simkaniaceae bacterium]